MVQWWYHTLMITYAMKFTMIPWLICINDISATLLQNVCERNRWKLRLDTFHPFVVLLFVIYWKLAVFNPNTGAYWRSGQSNHCTGVEETHGRTENPQQPRWQKKTRRRLSPRPSSNPETNEEITKAVMANEAIGLFVRRSPPPVSSPQVGSSSRTIPQNPQRSGTKTVPQQLHQI